MNTPDHREIFEWLRTHGVPDKDAEAKRSASLPPKDSRSRLETGRKQHRLVVDLHGLRYEEAVPVIRSGLERGKKSGCAAVIFVHGKGHHSDAGEGPVLKGLVRAMLENELALQVKDFYDAPPDQGGSGATIAYIA